MVGCGSFPSPSDLIREARAKPGDKPQTLLVPPSGDNTRKKSRPCITEPFPYNSRLNTLI